MSTELSRRELFRSLALTLAGLPACSVGRGHDPFALEKPPVPGADKWRRFQERRLATACAQCPAGCGVEVRVVEGRAVRIDGAVENPVNRGGVGPRGRSGLQVLYDPDRIHQPLRRKGARGSGTLEPVSWDEAVGELSERLASLREKREPHRVAIVCGRERGMMRELLERFALAYGTPNFFDGSSRGAGAVPLAIYLMQGIREVPGYDWTSTRYVLSLGAAVLEASCQGIYFSRATAHWRRGRAIDRGRIVHVEPSYSLTAANADEWISIQPGTYGAFALAIAYVLIREGTYDREFVAEHGFGFESWTDAAGRTHRGFRDLVLSGYAPEQVSAVCGVDKAIIERIAGEIGAARPAFAITDPRATHAPNGLHVAMAVHALNALLGAIDRPGGVLVQRPAPLAPWADVVLDEVAREGVARPRLDGVGARSYPVATSVPEALPNAIAGGEPYPLDALLLYYANPVYAWTNPERWRSAIEKVPFVVSFTPFLDETAALAADLVLPDHTYLERWEDAAPAPSVGFPIFGLRQPVVEPLHDTRATGDVVIGLAKELGAGIEEAFPWKDFRTALFQRIAGLQKSERGSIRKGSTNEFLRELVARGFWEDPPYRFGQWEEVLRTPSGKFEFFSQRLSSELEALGARRGMSVSELLREWGHDEDPDLVCLPHHDEIGWEGDEDFPLRLEPYKPVTYAEGSGANLPLLQELVTEPGQRAWITTVELHPDTARRLGVREEDAVEIESPVGKIAAPAHLHRGVRPGVIRIAQGRGHTAYGRFARGRGANVMELVAPRWDPFGGFPARIGTRVRLRRITT